MVIVVEGIDRVGKTTLCEKLSKKIRYPLYKKDREGEGVDLHNIDIDREIANAYMTYGNAMGIAQMVNNGFADNFIFDRFQWTESVYGLVDRKSQEAPYLMSLVEKEMERVPDKWLMVYVKPSDINRSIKEHGSDLVVHYNMYNYLVKETNLQLVICDGYEDIDKVVERISFIINSKEKIC